MPRPNISLVTIVKNEEHFLAQCLSSLKDVVSEMVVADTGSTDRTKEIAAGFGAKIIDVPWEDDFAKARNAALADATGDLVLHLDADEELVQEDVPALLEAASSAPLAFGLQVVDKKSGSASVAIRLFRLMPGVRYIGRIHEQPALGDDHAFKGKVAFTDIRILHHGYTSDVWGAKAKLERNQRLLEKMVEEDPEDELNLYYLAVTYSTEGKNDKAASLLMPYFGKHGSLQYSYVARYLVETLFALKQFEASLEVLDAALKDFPSYTDLHYLRGMALKAFGRPDEAAREFEECLRLGKAPAMYNTRPFVESAYPLFQLALIVSASSRPYDAVKYFEAAVKAKPGDKQIQAAREQFLRFMQHDH